MELMKRYSHVFCEVPVIDANSAALNIGQLAPFIAVDDIEDLRETIAQGVQQVVVGNLPSPTISSVPDILLFLFSTLNWRRG